MNTPPKLQVYCPVDPSELELTADGMFCRKCQHGLVDVSSPCGTKRLTNGVCGVMRRYIAPVLGSTIVLSSCSVDSGSSGSDQLAEFKSTGDRSSSGRQDIPIPGIYYHQGGDIYDPSDYPIAERTADPGIVISPYTQSKVDVSQMSEGQLVLDPAYKMTDKKFFRVPATRNR